MKIDANASVFPYELPKIIPRSPGVQLGSLLMKVQPSVRLLPGWLKKGVDEVGSLLAPILGSMSSSPQTYEKFLKKSQFDRALVVALPPLCSNEWLLEQSKIHKWMIPVVHMDAREQNPKKKLKEWVRLGAKGVRFHPAFLGKELDSGVYDSCIRAISDFQLPIIVHTGLVSSHFLYKNIQAACVTTMKRCFKKNPQIRWILSHCNMHEPMKAIETARLFNNLYLEMSWQPAETYREAVLRVGEDRVLFGSSYPFTGGTLDSSLASVRRAKLNGWVSSQAIPKIMGKNAENLFLGPKLLLK